MDFGESGLSEQAIVALLNEPARRAWPARPVRVTLTRNRISMISVRVPAHGPAHVRMHEAFRHAPRDVLLALRRYIRTRQRAAWREVGAYARSIAVAPTAAVPAPTGSAKGSAYDLEKIRREVNRSFFSGRVSCAIEWGRQQNGRRTRRRFALDFGSWHASRRLIRIHPLLDDPGVPEAFVRYIVFHEMLHAVVPPLRSGERVLAHPPQFRALERGYPDFKTMRAMTREILNAMLAKQTPCNPSFDSRTQKMSLRNTRESRK